MICAPDHDTVIVSIAAMRVVVFLVVSAFVIAFLTVIAEGVENDHGPPPRLGQ